MEEWPPIERGYLDDFGEIDPVVYKEAGNIWKLAKKFALLKLGDAPAGLQLMMKAVAQVSKKIKEDKSQEPASPPITNLPAYLYTTYKRLVLNAAAVESAHANLQEAFLKAPVPKRINDELDRKILIKQILLRMEPQMRRVYEQLAIGYTYEEIARKMPDIDEKASQSDLVKYAKVIRSRYVRELERIQKELMSETGTD